MTTDQSSSPLLLRALCVEQDLLGPRHWLSVIPFLPPSTPLPSFLCSVPLFCQKTTDSAPCIVYPVPQRLSLSASALFQLTKHAESTAPETDVFIAVYDSCGAVVYLKVSPGIALRAPDSPGSLSRHKKRHKPQKVSPSKPHMPPESSLKLM